jgi:hypothetical protein
MAWSGSLALAATLAVSLAQIGSDSSCLQTNLLVPPSRYSLAEEQLS